MAASSKGWPGFSQEFLRIMNDLMYRRFYSIVQNIFGFPTIQAHLGMKSED